MATTAYPAEPCIPCPVHCLIVSSVADTGPAEPVHSVPCPLPDCEQWPLLVLQNPCIPCPCPLPDCGQCGHYWSCRTHAFRAPVHCLIVDSVATTGPAEPVHTVPCPLPDCGQCGHYWSCRTLLLFSVFKKQSQNFWIIPLEREKREPPEKIQTFLFEQLIR